MLRRARAATTIPLVAIGGINAVNVAAVLETGVHAVAVIGAIAAAADPLVATREIMAAAIRTRPGN